MRGSFVSEFPWLLADLVFSFFKFGLSGNKRERGGLWGVATADCIYGGLGLMGKADGLEGGGDLSGGDSGSKNLAFLQFDALRVTQRNLEFTSTSINIFIYISVYIFLNLD